MTSAFAPIVVPGPPALRVSAELLAQLARLPGAVTTASDVLDGLGLAGLVAVDRLPRRTGVGVLAGHAVTVEYLPERRSLTHPELVGSGSRLGHAVIKHQVRPGDVVVCDAHGILDFAVVGGIAGTNARRSGASGFLVEGAVRDLNELDQAGLSIWARAVTPRSGKWRLEAHAVNKPVCIGGAQVVPGDLVIADDTGICFVPAQIATQVLTEVLAISEGEAAQLTIKRVPS
jgi:4-hydroxy-4-methyl-2-oxoglutarate aldolase